MLSLSVLMPKVS